MFVVRAERQDGGQHFIAPRMAALRNRLGNHPEHMAKSFDQCRAMVQGIGGNDIGRTVSILTCHIGYKEGSCWSI